MSKPIRSRERILFIIENPELFRSTKVSNGGHQEDKSKISSLQGQLVKRRRLGTRTPHRPAPVPQIQQPVCKQTTVEVQVKEYPAAKSSYQVVWRRGYPGIRHKRFTGDGKLKICGCSAILHDGDGRVLGEVTPFKLEDFLDGCILLVGSHECMLSE